MREKELEAVLAYVLLLLLFYLITGVRILVPIALVSGLMLGVSPKLSKWFYFIWHKMLQVLSFINSRVLLTIIFLLVFIPLGFLIRKSKRLTIQKKPSGKLTLFVERNSLYTKKDFVNPW